MREPTYYDIQGLRLAAEMLDQTGHTGARIELDEYLLKAKEWLDHGFCGEPYAHDCSRKHCQASDSYVGSGPSFAEFCMQFAAPVAVPITSAARDWPGGDYWHKECRGCGCSFHGPKREPFCYLCTIGRLKP